MPTISTEIAGRTVNGVAAQRGPIGVAGEGRTGNTVWVDKIGSDSTGTRARADLPFLTITAAKAAAQAGDVVHVRPGVYNEKNLLKPGVHMHFDAGAVVDYTGPDTGSIFDDTSLGADAACVCKVTGWGVFKNSTSNSSFFGSTSSPLNVFNIQNDGSYVEVWGAEVQVNHSSTGSALLKKGNGTVIFNVPRVFSSGSNYGITWVRGNTHVECKRIDCENGPAVADFSDAADPGTLYVDTDYAETSGGFSGCVISGGAAGSTFIFRAREVLGLVSAGGGGRFEFDIGKSHWPGGLLGQLSLTGGNVAGRVGLYVFNGNGISLGTNVVTDTLTLNIDEFLCPTAPFFGSEVGITSNNGGPVVVRVGRLKRDALASQFAVVAMGNVRLSGVIDARACEFGQAVQVADTAGLAPQLAELEVWAHPTQPPLSAQGSPVTVDVTGSLALVGAANDPNVTLQFRTVFPP